MSQVDATHEVLPVVHRNCGGIIEQSTVQLCLKCGLTSEYGSLKVDGDAARPTPLTIVGGLLLSAKQIEAVRALYRAMGYDVQDGPHGSSHVPDGHVSINGHHLPWYKIIPYVPERSRIEGEQHD